LLSNQFQRKPFCLLFNF